MPKFKKGDRVRECCSNPAREGTVVGLDKRRTQVYGEEVYSVLLDVKTHPIGRYGRLLAPILDLPIKDVWKGLINV